MNNNEKLYKWRVLYKPPLEELDDNNLTTWRKTFYISKYECPSKLDLDIKIRNLKYLYNMKDEYIILEDLENIDKK